jgi:integrase
MFLHARQLGPDPTFLTREDRIGRLKRVSAHKIRAGKGGGGELEQIQFLLGHVSLQTTERHLGCKQRLRNAVNDRIGLEPDFLRND